MLLSPTGCSALALVDSLLVGTSKRGPERALEVVLAQYHSIQSLIQTGRMPGKKDAKGPTPPLRMPSWRRELSVADIDAIIAYLLHTRHQEESRATAESAVSAP